MNSNSSEKMETLLIVIVIFIPPYAMCFMILWWINKKFDEIVFIMRDIKRNGKLKEFISDNFVNMVDRLPEVYKKYVSSL